MRISITPTFLESFSKLPRQAQKQAQDFLVKFEQNSRSASIHLEKIGSFKDQSLRTARISDKYRAVVKVPKTGDIHYLLHVDNHDEAMRWAEDKVFAWNEHTDAVQLYTAPDALAPNPPAAPAPSRTAPPRLFAAIRAEDLLALGVPEAWLERVAALEDLDQLDLLSGHLPDDAFENLFGLADGLPLAELLETMRLGKAKAEDASDMEKRLQSPNNRRNFWLPDDQKLAEALSGDWQKWQIFLHPSQNLLAYRAKTSPMKVTGGAGTGKTTLAVHRAAHLARQGKGPILFTTYTKALVAAIEAQLGLMGLADSARETIRVQNLDALAFQLAREHELLPTGWSVLDFEKNSETELSQLWRDATVGLDLSPEFAREEYQEVIAAQGLRELRSYLVASRQGRGASLSRRQRAEIWNAYELFRKTLEERRQIDRAELFNRCHAHFAPLMASQKPFQHVLLDELQDFAAPELRLVASLVPEKGELLMVGDPFQNIYGRKLNFQQCGISVRGKRSQRLKVNYRTTQQIRSLALRGLAGSAYDDFEGGQESLAGYISLHHGLQPTLMRFDSPDEERAEALAQIRRWIDEQDILPEQIGAMTYRREDLSKLRTLLHNQRLPYLDKPEQMHDAKKEGVRLLTLHNSKGLEFKAVLIFAYESSSSITRHLRHDPPRREQARKDYGALSYVAMSRAVQFLYLSGRPEAIESLSPTQNNNA